MTSGIYILTNKANGYRYIGYSENIETRWTENKQQLQIGSFGEAHRNLINDYQASGEEAFVFGILEVTVNNQIRMARRAEIWKRMIQPEYNRAL